MKKSECKKSYITNILADYLLCNGLSHATLKKMAAVAKMSDRMLLHYFKNKEELLTAILQLLQEKFSALLKGTTTEKMDYQQLIIHLVTMLDHKDIRPYLKLTLEFIAKTATEEEYYNNIAKIMFCNFFEWICSMIKVENEKDKIPTASMVFVMIEGFVLLDAASEKEVIKNALDCIYKLPKI